MKNVKFACVMAILLLFSLILAGCNGTMDNQTAASHPPCRILIPT